MYTISKEFHFSAGHHLEGLPDTHPCSRFHGHNYVVTVILRSEELNEVGFVMDYRNLDSMKKFIDEQLDHQDLNKKLPINPTAENIAKYLYEIFHLRISKVIAVQVSETPKTNAIYEE